MLRGGGIGSSYCGKSRIRFLLLESIDVTSAPPTGTARKIPRSRCKECSGSPAVGNTSPIPIGYGNRIREINYGKLYFIRHDPQPIREINYQSVLVVVFT
eukprot:8403599-Pyramimonas_sp.AAC.1